jgi:hypothetical protein
MSLARTLAKFATSPQGRRTINQARTKLDTPENRRKLSGLLNRRGAGAGGAGTTATRQTAPRP